MVAAAAELGPASIEAVGAEYTRRWLPNAQAVVDLTVEAFGDNRRAVTFNLKFAQVCARRRVYARGVQADNVVLLAARHGQSGVCKNGRGCGWVIMGWPG